MIDGINTLGNWIEQHQGLASWIQGIGTIIAVLAALVVSRSDLNERRSRDKNIAWSKLKIGFMLLKDELDISLTAPVSSIIQSAKSVSNKLYDYCASLPQVGDVSLREADLAFIFSTYRELNRHRAILLRAIDGRSQRIASFPGRLTEEEQWAGWELTADEQVLVRIRPPDEHMLEVWKALQTLNEYLSELEKELAMKGVRKSKALKYFDVDGEIKPLKGPGTLAGKKVVK